MSFTTYEIPHFIGGRWVGRPEQERVNPARPGDKVALAASGDHDTVASAVAAARTAQPAWASTTSVGRGAVLARAAEILSTRRAEIARDLTREEGKTFAEASGEVSRAAGILRFFGGEGSRMPGQTMPSAVADTFVYTKGEALGVVGLITPWNFPIAIPAWKMAPALIAGNTVVIKPAALTPVSVWHLARALDDAGLPEGVLNVVYGSGGVLGDALVSHPDVGAISFTGSTAVGRSIHGIAAARMARVQLEMGGKNALVVLDDADPERAARIAAAGAFGLTGQACTATSRVICTPGVRTPFIEALVEQAKEYRAGDGLAEGTRMGAVVSESQLRTDRDYLAVAAREGGHVVSTGDSSPAGLLLDPAVVTNVDPHHRIAQEEVFGPVVAVLPAADLDDAIAIANGVSYGLCAGLVTNDLRATHRFADGVQAGVVKVNRPTSGVDLNVPFGGVKDSSTNTYREQASTAVDFYSWTKSVYIGVD